jgi:phosphatidate cytidylyltransferase
MDSNLAKRLIVAAVAIPATLVLAWYGSWPLVLIVAIIGVLGVRELFEFAERQQIRPSRPIGFVTAALFAPLAYAVTVAPGVQAAVRDAWPYAAALWLVALLTWALAARRPVDRPLGAAAVTLFAPLYSAALLAFLVPIRHAAYDERSWAGAWLIFYPLVVTWVCDSAAMFGGRAMKGPKLAPSVSPGKTRSGSLAGLVGGLMTAVVFRYAVFPQVGVEAGLGALLLIAGVLSVVGQVGDLAESLFKREVGVKDSGTLIPGHGGVLDRFDSLYFVVPVAAALYQVFGLI